MSEKMRIRLLGILFIILGIVFTVYTWNRASRTGYYYVSAVFLSPFAACAGLMLFLFPLSRKESQNKYGSEWAPFSEYPLGVKILLALGIILGFFNWYLISGGINLF